MNAFKLVLRWLLEAWKILKFSFSIPTINIQNDFDHYNYIKIEWYKEIFRDNFWKFCDKNKFLKLPF